MTYENRPIPEGINVSQEHPLKELLLLTLGISLVVVITVAVLSLTAEYLVKYIPFETEQRFLDIVLDKAESTEKVALPDAKKQEHAVVQAYLQQLADKLAIAQQLPSEMSISVHYLADETVNAFATLGGHIFIYRGLLEKMPSENALSMVLAHEIAHIKHRDPIVALGRGLTISIALASIAGISDSSIVEGVVGQVSTLTTLTFNRDQERNADIEALNTLMTHYGHANGAEALFEILLANNGIRIPAFLSTHPLSGERIERIKAFQQKHKRNGQLQPLGMSTK